MCMALKLSLLKGCLGAVTRASQEGSGSHCTLCALRDAPGGKKLLLSTLHEEYEFFSPSSVAIAEMVALFLGGLKERSVFAMALQDRRATGTHWEREGAHRTSGEGWLSPIHKTQGRLRDTSIHITGSGSAMSSPERVRGGVLHVHSTNTTGAFTDTSKVNVHLQGRAHHPHNHPDIPCHRHQTRGSEREIVHPAPHSLP